jgi:hypothetical protein
MLLVSWMEREPPLELEEPIGLGQETITSVTITRASQDSTHRLVFIRFPPKNHFGESIGASARITDAIGKRNKIGRVKKGGHSCPFLLFPFDYSVQEEKR